MSVVFAFRFAGIERGEACAHQPVSPGAYPKVALVVCGQCVGVAYV